ncbi:hypothetical protein PENTCL1PPCAC_20887, partial [Pristionchus entomophagus]
LVDLFLKDCSSLKCVNHAESLSTARFAFSHPTLTHFAEECDHNHDKKCSNCDQVDAPMAHLKSLTDRLANEADSSDSPSRHRIRWLNEIIEYSCKSIRSYQAHILR